MSTVLDGQRWAFNQVTNAMSALSEEPEGEQIVVLDQHDQQQEHDEGAWVQVSYGNTTTRQFRGGHTSKNGSIIVDCYSLQDQPDRADHMAEQVVSVLAFWMDSESGARFGAEVRTIAPEEGDWAGIRITVPFSI